MSIRKHMTKRMKKSKRPWDWDDFSVEVPPTGTCVICGSMSWLLSYQGIRNGEALTVFQKWNCLADDTHRINVLVIDDEELNYE